MTTAIKPEADVWGIVETFGHQRIAGRLSDHSIGGTTFLRVDVPPLLAGIDAYGTQTVAVDGHTKLYGGAAIYAISFVDETAARVAAAEIRHVPIQTYSVEQALTRMGVDGRKALGLDSGGGDDFDTDR